MEKSFSSPITVCIIAFVIGASCEQYVPGTPGGPWTDTEVAIVRQKVIQMLNQTNYLERPRGHAPLFHKGNLLLTAYHGCTKGNCEPTTFWGNYMFLTRGTRRPNAAKLLRLAFHDCVSNVDEHGNHFGGCDGCFVECQSLAL